MPYTQKVADTLEKVVNSVNAAMPGIVEQIILYGSYARGDYSPESDLDIMLLMNCKRNTILKILMLSDILMAAWIGQSTLKITMQKKIFTSIL